MCGIGGIIRTGVDSNGEFRPEQVTRLSSALAHRGPDDLGFLGWRAGEPARPGRDAAVVAGMTVTLVHRRLSILDLSPAGAQPMSTPDGRLWIVYNGEIYNFVEVRAKLAAIGHRFRSSSDTEVLLAAYAEWGTDMLARLEGMFAFALLDCVKKQVLMARDPFGIKPLYFCSPPGQIVFASEIGALMPFLPRHRAVHPQRLFDYLRYGTTDDTADTMLEGVWQLLPGHLLQIDVDNDRGSAQRPYWKLAVDPREVSFDEAVREVKERFLLNVERHLRSDVPVGACLSGGIDSSACVAAMRHLRPDLELHTFSYVADSPDLSEDHWMRLAGQSSVPHMISASPEGMVSDLDTLIAAQGEPFASTSVYAQFRIFREIANTGIKVVLDGQGADEIFGGYATFVGARIASLMRQGRVVDAFRMARAASRRPGLEAIHAIASKYLLPRFLQYPIRKILHQEVVPAWLNSRWFGQFDVRLVPPEESLSHVDVLRSACVAAISGNLRALLRYEDRNSMASSVESRVPFLTPEFVQYALSLPEAYLIAEDGTTKSVFRAAMRGIVRDEILDRRDKIAFQTPERDWLMGLRPWVESILSSEVARSIPAIRVPALRQVWDLAPREPSWNQSRLWRCLNLVRWVELSGAVFDDGLARAAWLVAPSGSDIEADPKAIHAESKHAPTGESAIVCEERTVTNGVPMERI